MGTITSKASTTGQFEPNKFQIALEEAKTRRESAEALSTEEYIVVRKISALVDVVEAQRPKDNNGIGSDTMYEPCFTSNQILNAVEDKMLQLIKQL